jgi:hypothetical protein
MTLGASYDACLRSSLDVRGLVGDDPTLLITDDKPFNKYYLLRRWLD